MLLLILAVISSAEINRIEAVADSLLAIGEYDGAVLEYKRCLYLDSFDTTGRIDTLLVGTKLALAMYRYGETEEGENLLYDLDGPTVRMIRAILLIEQNEGFLAARQVDSATRDAFGADAYRLRGWAYTEAGLYPRAAEEFRKADEEELAERVEALSELRLKNPRLARWLSILPGLGETYAGRPLFGLWALLVNAGDTYLIVKAILEERYVDAVLVYTFLWQRFYTGSMANADRFAREWNERKLEEVAEPIRQEFNQAGDLRLDLPRLNELRMMATQE